MMQLKGDAIAFPITQDKHARKSFKWVNGVMNTHAVHAIWPSG